METPVLDAHGASLLLLEDDWDHRNVFRDFLRHRGWTVREATQASSAREVVAAERIDVVVVDLGGTNGWSLLEDLGSQPGRPRLVCLTSDARTESRDRAVGLGADQYLVKPIPLRQLAAEVERFLGAGGEASSELPPAGARSTDTPRRRNRRAPRRKSQSTREPVAPSTDRHERPRPVVLLLEDDDDARAIYSDMLDFAGYEVLAASDGLEGLKYAEARHPDIVVTDLHMPGMNGLEVARTLRGESDSTAAIIAVTADSLGVDAARASGGEQPLFDQVLVKPVSPGDLVRAIRSFVPAPEDEAG